MSNLWCTPDDLGDLAESEYAMEACQSASFLLWALSGRKFSGITEVTEVYSVPGRTPSAEDLYAAQTFGTVARQFFANLPNPYTTLRLRGGPATSITTVRVGTDLIELDPSDYFISDHAVLNFTTAIRDDIEVTYTYGGKPPTMGQVAARVLAKEFVLSWSNSEECTLPARVTSISRQGMTYTILDQQDFIADLRTGVYAVDLFLKSVNPDRALRKSKVFSPDVPRGRRNPTLTDLNGFGAGGFGYGGFGY